MSPGDPGHALRRAGGGWRLRRLCARRAAERGRAACRPRRGGARLRAVRRRRAGRRTCSTRRSLAFSHAWETDREDRSQLRARIIGGCSAHNACVVLAGAPADYDEWGHGWSHAAIAPYLERAERELRVRQVRRARSSRPGTRRSPTRPATTRSCTPSTRSARCAGTPPSPTSTRRAARENLTILADTLVDRVLLRRRPRGRAWRRGGRAARRHGRARRGRLRLAGDPAAQRHRPARELPVGEGLIDHVGVGFGFEGTDRLQREAAAFERARPLFMAQVTVAVASSACAPGVCDLFLFPALERGARATR